MGLRLLMMAEQRRDQMNGYEQNKIINTMMFFIIFDRVRKVPKGPRDANRSRG